MVRLLLLFFFVSMSISLCGQEVVTSDNAPKKVLKIYQKAEKCLSKGETEEALEKLQKAILEEPRFMDAYLKIAAIHYELGQFENAATSFKSALELDPDNFRLVQSVAVSYEKAKNNTSAITYFTQLLSFEDKLNEEYREEIKEKIETFSFRQDALKNPVPFAPVLLPSNINDPKRSEYSPSLTADGKRLFFTRLVSNQEDIYFSEMDSSGEWSVAKMLPNLNTLENEGAHNISADGKIILFTYCSDGKRSNVRGCNIYVSFKQKGLWTTPQYFDAINSKAWDTQPNVSSDGKTVIFTSLRPGGYGNSDLWWSKRNEDGKWTIPENLGDVINTRLREESPFLHPDGKSLYFKSEGHPGMGSFDLFRSELQENGKWSKPENLGYPINTEDHEGSMIISLDGKTAIYSRGNGKVSFDRTQSDLFTFTLPESARAKPVGFVKIRVYDAESKLPIEANIKVQSSFGLINSYETDNEASRLVTLPLGQDYSLNIEKEAYYFYSERFELNTLNTEKSAFEIEVYLQPIKDVVAEENEPIILKNILFETGSYQLKEESFFELDQLFRLLSDNSKLKIEVRGHTDNVGDDAANQLLSENRAKSVYDYLVQKGISKDRLTFVGFGESKPIASNESEIGREINRRTEFITKQ
jgi:outer membrane protein OmpA-like peptidoglycan-associated protein/tetratricopeptide (TPR) repeat protein